MLDRYVLMLVPLNPDRSDCSGNIYPESGYVESQDFQFNDNILHGLYGIAWGQYRTSRWVNPDPEAQWCVVRTERNNEMYVLDKYDSFTKFRSGLVVRSGTKQECEEYVARQRRGDSGAFGLKPELAAEK